MATQARLNRFYDALEKLDSPDFFVQIRAYDLSPSTPITGLDFRRNVRRWLSTLDYEQVRKAIDLDGRVASGMSFIHEDEQISFVAIPKGETRGKPGIRPLAAFPFRFFYGDPSISSIRDAIIKKSSRYGRPTHPYLVAVEIHDFTSSPASVKPHCSARKLAVER